MFNPRLLAYLLLAMLLLAGCTAKYPESSPQSTPIGLIDADEITSDDSLPFRFPLEESTIDYELFFGWFGVSNECPPNKPDCYNYSDLAFHAAEDYKRPAGTPVYAMADGRVSFSGTAGGYGWLIIIDHPQFNLYSLYGHLSPSRWKLPSGEKVKKGDLIAYLGDPDENGGSAEESVGAASPLRNPRRPNGGLPQPRRVALHGRVDPALPAGFGLAAALAGHHQPGNHLGRISTAGSGFPDPLGTGTAYHRLLHTMRSGDALLRDSQEFTFHVLLSWCALDPGRVCPAHSKGGRELYIALYWDRFAYFGSCALHPSKCPPTGRTHCLTPPLQGIEQSL